MIKALFFDIDGTLVSFKTHRIPLSTVEALTEAKGKGVKIFISTGRPVAIIDNLGQIEHLIDGYVTTNGAYCFMDKDIVSCSPIAHAEVEEFTRRIMAHRYACMYVGDRHTAMVNPNDISRHVCDLLNIKPMPSYPLDVLIDQNIIQLTPIATVEEERDLLDGLHDIESGRWHPAFADLTAKGVNKALGLHEMCRYLGLDIADTMAFGDGGNDMSIIKAAGIGVAMGNAEPDLKSIADYVTADIDNGGIGLALKYFGLI